MKRRHLVISKFLVISLVFIMEIAAYTDSDSIDRIKSNFGKNKASYNWNEESDINKDGVVDGDDLTLAVQMQNKKLDPVGQNYIQTHVLVKFEQNLHILEISKIVSALGSVMLDAKPGVGSGYCRIEVPHGSSVESFIHKIVTNPHVTDAQPDYICCKTMVPNDSEYQYQWNFQILNAPLAWDLAMGGKENVVVAVLDTGIAYEDNGEYKLAPDLAGTHFVKGTDILNNDTHPNDDDGHGTHVAGTISQTTNNNIGVAGLAYECSLMPVKILDSTGSGTSYTLSEGLTWAQENGAQVINMSLGFDVGTNPGKVVKDAIEKAYAAGIIMVAAAGNEGDTYGYTGGIDYPAAYPQVVSVGAIRFDKRRAYYSNYGNGLICVAPGGDLRVDQNNDGYGDGILQQTFSNHNYGIFKFYFFEGTSMATPHVSAAAALFKSRRGGGPDAFISALHETCQDIGTSGYDPEYGYGIIDLVKIIKKGYGWGADN
jgi:serine protease